MQSALFALAAFLTALYLFTKPLGLWIEPLAAGRSPSLVAKADAFLLRRLGVSDAEQSWRTYAVSLVAFNVAGAVLLYALLRLQGFLPLNPAGLEGMPAAQALNTAVSFVTNTNWQSYAGETALTPFSQAAGLTVQNFLSAATGICTAFVLMRGFARAASDTVGNFWADLVRVSLWLLLPLSLACALVLVWQGVPQTLDASAAVQTLAGQSHSIPLGPVASQEAIKLLGTNGGGFFNANSAHPFENPTQLSNFFEAFLILCLSCALLWVFGRLVGDVRQGWTLWAAMALVFAACVLAFAWFETHPVSVASALGSGPMNMEGKDVRFDAAAASLFTIATTSASCGAVNLMHDSLTPLGGLLPLWLMQTGEVIFGGVGSGLYGILVFAVIAVFVAGLMVGRTPEYLGKRINPPQMKLACLAMLASPLLVLTGTAASCLVPGALESLHNGSAHGFSELLYAWTSAANNNGSAFAGLNANTDFYNLGLAAAMWFGRFVPIAAVLALAGTLAAAGRTAPSSGTLPTSGALFAGLLVAVVLLIGALTYLPALALGPIAEHLTLAAETAAVP